MSISYFRNPDDSIIRVENLDGVETSSGDLVDGYENASEEEYDAYVAGIASQIDDNVAAAEADLEAVHDGDVKLYRYITAPVHDKTIPPHDVDYITGIDTRLHPTNAVIVDGEVRRIEYYASAQPPNAQGVVVYDDLVVSEDFVYTRDAIGFARARVQTITWYTEDDQPHPSTKQRVKYYENDESLREGQRRRGNITDSLSMNLAGWLVATQTQLPNPQDRIDLGRDFMREYKIDFDMFVDASSSGILYLVRDNVEPEHAWLDDELTPGVTIRATILDALNIWNLTL